MKVKVLPDSSHLLALSMIVSCVTESNAFIMSKAPRTSGIVVSFSYHFWSITARLSWKVRAGQNPIFLGSSIVLFSKCHHILSGTSLSRYLHILDVENIGLRHCLV